MTARLARSLATAVLERLHVGQVTIVEGGRRRVFGSGAPAATVLVRDPAAWTALLRGSRGLAESYARGLWDSPDLTAVVRVAARNVVVLDDVRRRLSPIREPYQRTRAAFRRNTPRRSRRDISAHYDLGNELFSLMLDPTMMYSCALFESPEETLEAASIAKLDLVCDKLALGPEDRVLEIGTGWGGFALHAAATRGCHVTTTTISREQHDYAQQRIRAAGLEDQVTLLLKDYRDLEGSYDKLVSIEMIEAVGWQDFDTFFAKSSSLLEQDGAMLLQAITMDDRAYMVERASKSFIRTHVFPGGCLPSPEVIARCVGRVTDLRTVHLEDLSPHYAETLRRWRDNADNAADQLEALGYDERFRRLWRMYLSYCEGGFAERRIGLVQQVLAKPNWRGPALGAGSLSHPRSVDGARPAGPMAADRRDAANRMQA
jgi:cyclopropane-fatty-acyl-phospholipid synthase